MLLGFVADDKHGEQCADAAAECGEDDKGLLGDAANGAARQFADRLIIYYDDGGYDVDEQHIYAEHNPNNRIHAFSTRGDCRKCSYFPPRQSA